MKASEFKAKCLKLMDEVADSGEEIVITKYGRPVSKLVPLGRSLKPSLALTKIASRFSAISYLLWTWNGKPSRTLTGCSTHDALGYPRFALAPDRKSAVRDANATRD